MMKNFIVVYASLLATVVDRLEPDEVDSFISLGVAIHRRTNFIPVSSGE